MNYKLILLIFCNCEIKLLNTPVLDDKFKNDGVWLLDWLIVLSIVFNILCVAGDDDAICIDNGDPDDPDDPDDPSDPSDPSDPGDPCTGCSFVVVPLALEITQLLKTFIGL